MATSRLRLPFNFRASISSLSDTPTDTETPTISLTPSETPTASDTPTPSETPSETPTLTPTPIPVPNVEGAHRWHYQYDKLQRVVYACSDWENDACTSSGHEFHYEYDGAGNATRFDRWNSTTYQVETVHYVYNGANQIDCVDADNNQQCGDLGCTSNR